MILKKKTKKIFTIVGVIVCIALIVFGSIMLFNSKKGQDKNTKAQQESADYTKQVESMFAVPDEKAEIATVKDKSLLSTQPFFAKAQNGDVLFVYPKNALALLFRPSEKKIINIAPLINDTQQAPFPSPSAAVVPKK
jgi:FtsZ-interacting cell division protein ZipA